MKMKEFKDMIKEKVNYEENESKIKKGLKITGGVLAAGALLGVGIALGKRTTSNDDELEIYDEDFEEIESDSDDLYLCSSEQDETDEEFEDIEEVDEDEE